MGNIVAATAINVGAFFTGAVAGQDLTANGATPTTGTGDMYPINSGTGTLIIITSAGTGGTMTFDSVVASNYGVDTDVVVTWPATGLTIIFLDQDGVRRFDQGGGNPNMAKGTPSVSTNVKVYAVIIP